MTDESCCVDRFIVVVVAVGIIRRVSLVGFVVVIKFKPVNKKAKFIKRKNKRANQEREWIDY